MQNPRWVRRPEGSNWGEFGPDDNLGRLNLITPEKVRAGVAEVVEGRSFCLRLPLDLPGGTALNPNRFPPVLRPNLRAGQVNFNFGMDRLHPGHTDVLCDDLAVLHLQYSTQWDSLAHAGSMFDADGDGVPEPVFYNGFRADEHVLGPSGVDDAGTASLHDRSTSTAGPLGIDHMARTAVQGRAVLIDLRAHLGDERTLVGYQQLAEIIAADRIVVEEGDIVCLHTGFAEQVVAMAGDPDPEVLHGSGAVLNGRDPDLLRWITDSGLAALVADNYAVEAFPAPEAPVPNAVLPLHEHCLFKLGVHLGELWRLTPLAEHLRARGRSRFLLTAPPLNLPGAAGSPVTPVATV
ncbi:cyclase family protein [Saccharopolyspora indica]|uniref:cyclase family protein n=1 Tax=Saccharopolyspora indica TaxID=1229659 RepID=UPI0022EA59B8|nr:cyclase family protein [Saccharopolyspora indica]MDA3643015.1 cyclase family protein [Saccharopolyspora indica]